MSDDELRSELSKGQRVHNSSREHGMSNDMIRRLNYPLLYPFDQDYEDDDDDYEEP